MKVRPQRCESESPMLRECVPSIFPERVETKKVKNQNPPPYYIYKQLLGSLKLSPSFPQHQLFLPYPQIQ